MTIASHWQCTILQQLLSTIKVAPGEELGRLYEVQEVEEDKEMRVYSLSADSRGGDNKRVMEVLNTISINSTSLQCDKVKALVSQFQQIFAVSPTELGQTEVVRHSIDNGDHSPIKQCARRIPFTLRNVTEEMVEDMLQQGVIKESVSPWVSPVVLVKKKDGSMRFCVDYRKLNAITKKDVFPLPRIDNALDLLGNSVYFSTLDLASGYWQVKMDTDSREKTAFTTHKGLYEFSIMPFGLCNAPATFQRLMERVLKGLVGESCMVYLDDILVIGKTFEQHMDNLKKVFGRIERAVKPKKCHLIQPCVEYLGYVVSRKGISADPRKIQAIVEYPVPVDVKSLRSFLGLASYYRRFARNFSRIAYPLSVNKKRIDIQLG